MFLFTSHILFHSRHLLDNLSWCIHCLAQGHFNKTHRLFQGSNLRPCIYETISNHPARQPRQRWIGSKVSDACSETPHKACSHSFSVPEISEMINSCGIPVEMAVKLQPPYSIPHAKIHRQPWPFCASAANGTLSSWVCKLKDQCDFVGVKLLWCRRSVHVWASWKRKKEKQRTKQGWSTASTSAEQLKVEHQMAENERHSLCENQRQKSFHSLLNTAHSRGGKAVYSFSNASVSVYVCVSVWLSENREVIER